MFEDITGHLANKVCYVRECDYYKYWFNVSCGEFDKFKAAKNNKLTVNQCWGISFKENDKIVVIED